MLRRYFVLPLIGAIAFALFACQDSSNSTITATTQSDGGSDDGSDSSMNTETSAGDSCATATTLTETPLVDQRTTSSGDRNAICENADAPQRFYSFVIPAHQRAALHFTPALGSLIARIMDGCDATSCLAHAASVVDGGGFTMVMDNPLDEPLTRIVSVSASDAGETITFDIRLEFAPIPAAPEPGTTCAHAAPITPGTYLSEQTATDGDRTTTCDFVDAPQRFYSFEIPAHQHARVDITPASGIVIGRSLASCDTSGCFHTDRSATPGGAITLEFDNGSDALVTRFVSVSAATADATITFDIRLDVTPIVTPPAGATCADATPMTATTLVNQRTTSDGDRNAVCENVDAPQRFYSFVLPAHQRATIHVAPETGSVIARALAGCSETSCLTDDRSDVDGDDVTLVIDSPGDEPLTKIISVGSAAAGATITFDIRLDLTPLPPDGV